MVMAAERLELRVLPLVSSSLPLPTGPGCEASPIRKKTSQALGARSTSMPQPKRFVWWSISSLSTSLFVPWSPHPASLRRRAGTPSAVPSSGVIVFLGSGEPGGDLNNPGRGPTQSESLEGWIKSSQATVGQRVKAVPRSGAAGPGRASPCGLPRQKR